MNLQYILKMHTKGYILIICFPNILICKLTALICFKVVQKPKMQIYIAKFSHRIHVTTTHYYAVYYRCIEYQVDMNQNIKWLYIRSRPTLPRKQLLKSSTNFQNG